MESDVFKDILKTWCLELLHAMEYDVFKDIMKIRCLELLDVMKSDIFQGYLKRKYASANEQTKNQLKEYSHEILISNVFKDAMNKEMDGYGLQNQDSVMRIQDVNKNGT